jgi:hypothetical protein
MPPDAKAVDPLLLVYIHLRAQIVILTSQIVVLTYCLIVLTTMVLYLLACDPLPPCTGKVKEWLRLLRSARVPSRGESVGERGPMF